ncbi:hypothetical protein CCR75_000826 [Bremia lactucae]|uniref:EamA domain-containing protein n=1 Tax=Bremia lactucae TaxID=4779 RepID=A0A976FP28_BRELC|nr:hypothetical protein CCR75_000826 [Bremia lactucae]
MTRANIVAVAWPAAIETTKLLDSAEALKKGATPSRPAKLASFIALTALIWSWVLQAEATQSLQVFFRKPFFLTCFNHTAPVILLPILVGYTKLYGTSKDQNADFVNILQAHSVIPLTKLVSISGTLSLVFLVSDLFWYSALDHVNVAAGIAISNSSPLFVYCFSVCFLNEHLSSKKLSGVLLAFLGVLLIVLFQERSHTKSMEFTTIIAGFSILLSAAIYAAYQVALQLAMGDDNITDTSTLLTLAGLTGLFAFPPWIIGTLLLNASPFEWLHESFAFPTTTEGVFLLSMSGTLTVVFCAFLPLAICWTSPLETSVGCMLTIPLSAGLDLFIRHTSFSWQSIAGSVFVMAGFGILECSSTSSAPLCIQEESRRPSAVA